jgi:hypothetical protein
MSLKYDARPCGGGTNTRLVLKTVIPMASAVPILMAFSLNAVDCGLLYRNHIDPREALSLV